VKKNVVCPGIGLHLKSGRYADSRVRIRKERKKMKFVSKAYKPSDGQIRLALIYLSVAQIHTISRNEAWLTTWYYFRKKLRAGCINLTHFQSKLGLTGYCVILSILCSHWAVIFTQLSVGVWKQ